MDILNIIRNMEGKLQMTKKVKNQKGITLVALVVTIIVIIILSTVTISAVFRRRWNVEESTRNKRHNTK